MRSIAGKTIIQRFPFQEAGQQGKAVSLALFRVELHAHDIVTRHGGHQPAAVIGHGGDRVPIVRGEVIGVEEIGLTRFDQRGVGRDLHVVPAHVRDLDRGIGPLDQTHFAADPAKAGGGAMLNPAVGQKLHSHADAQERCAADDHPLAQRLFQMRDRAQAFGAGLEAAHAGQDDPVRRADHIGIGSDSDALRASSFQGIGDRVEVARAVVDESKDFTHVPSPAHAGKPGADATG